MFLGSEPSAGPIFDDDPLDYDKLVHLDAESLAEQGILSAYKELIPELLQYTPKPLEVTEEIDNDAATYVVRAAEKRVQILDQDAANRDGWERATVAFFEIVNADLLDSSHRFYALYVGNDLCGLFLTAEEFAAAHRPIKRRSDWPWLPVNEPPHMATRATVRPDLQSTAHAKH